MSPKLIQVFFSVPLFSFFGLSGFFFHVNYKASAKMGSVAADIRTSVHTYIHAYTRLCVCKHVYSKYVVVHL